MLHFFGIAPRITTANVKKQMTPAKKNATIRNLEQHLIV
jgi:hypothetical protein